MHPITFHYRPELDRKGIPQFGLIAEGVAKVNPDLVTYDAKGDICTVRYEAVNVMLFNEFLREHKTVQELNCTVQKQEATLAQQQKSFQSKLAEQEKQIKTLISGLQKVTARVDLKRHGPQMTSNDQ